MAGKRARSNAWLWASLLALVLGVIAAALHAIMGYFAVRGARFDWLVHHPQKVISPEMVAVELGISIFLVTAQLVFAAGTIGKALARKGRMRGKAEKAETGGPVTWGSFVGVRVLVIAGIGALVGSLGGYMAGTLQDPQGLAGQEFFVFKVALGTAVVVLGAFSLVRAMAHAHAAGRFIDADPRGNFIARIQLASAKGAPIVVLIVVLLTATFGAGLTKLHTNVDVADVLPRGDGNTTAAQNLTTQFKSTFTQQVTLQFPANRVACEADRERELPNFVDVGVPCTNLTHEVYVRALEELFQILENDPGNPIRHNIGINAFYKLINWTIAGGQGAAASSFGLPGRSPFEEQRFAQVHTGVWKAIPDVVSTLLSPSGNQTASLYLVSTTETATTREIGEAMLAFRDKYVRMVEDGETHYTVWGADNPPLFTVDIPVANAHASELTREDFVTLFPLIFGFIIVTLYFSFRNLAAIGIAGAMLLVASVWTFGLMGHMDIALNTLNLTILPLILGAGIDFAIHQINEFSKHKNQGLSDAEALRLSGELSGFAMFVATATTVSGLLVMTVSPSLLMAQLGLLAAIGMASIYLLVITFVPALLALARSSDAMGRQFRPSTSMLSLARVVSKRRMPVALLVLFISSATLLTATTIDIEEFGEPAKNFPADDPIRREHEKGVRGFYGLEPGEAERKTNILVFQGDNTDIQSHRYIEAVQGAMRDKDNLHLETSRTLPFLMRIWLTVKDGVPGAGIEIVRENLLGTPLDPVSTGADPYPTTRAEIEREVDAIFASPLSTFGSLFLDYPENQISIMTFATDTGDFDVAKAGWEDVWTSVNEVKGLKPNDLEPSFVGNTALNYLFITKELPWLGYLGIVSAIAVALLTILFMRSLRAMLAVTVVMVLTTSWWLGILPLLDIGLAITLMLPAIFITSVGSDFAVHYAWNLLNTRDRAEVYGSVGKAVLYSMITTVGAFVIFTRTQNIAAAKAMLATVVAFLVIFVVTILVMPLFFPVRNAADEEPEGHARPEAEEPPLDRVPRTRVVDRTPADM